MVFSSLHNVKELTFNWEKKKRVCFMCFPIFDLINLGIQGQNDAKPNSHL